MIRWNQMFHYNPRVDDDDVMKEWVLKRLWKTAPQPNLLKGFGEEKLCSDCENKAT